MRNHPDYFPQYANEHVDNMAYTAEVDGASGQVKIDIGVLIGTLPDVIMTGVSIAAVKALDTFNPLFRREMMGRYGRNVVVVASGAATATLRIRGIDYLGQPMVEDIVLNGTTPVVGKKAFRRVRSVTPSAAVAATTINVGIGNVLGLPYFITALVKELVDNVAPAAGTFVPGSAAAQTATSTDPRGTYTPAGAVIPNGARNIELYGMAKQGNLHGERHFFA